MFAVGDYIIHPLHGAGVVEEIVKRPVKSGSREYREYYVFRAFDDNITVMLPVSSCEEIGVRAVVTPDEAQTALDSFADMVCPVCENWNRRYRDNMERLKSGKIEEVMLVVKTLMLRENKRQLSTGERKLFSTAKRILYSELSLVTDKTPEVLDAYFLSALFHDEHPTNL